MIRTIRIWIACRRLNRLIATQRQREFNRRSAASRKGWATRNLKEAVRSVQQTRTGTVR